MTYRVGYDLTLHASQTYLALVDALTLPPEQLPTMDFQLAKDQAPAVFRADAEQVRKVKALLQQILGRESIPPLILLNANAGDLLPLRRWPLERYVELAQ